MSWATNTWDGVEIAVDEPRGSTIVVRRRGTTGDPEFLMLHRNAHGPDFEGDWAWTSPAGARQPGEPVYTAALRELAEEAGLVDVQVFAVDLSLPWAVFAADVDRGAAIDLVDPEHDRYEWLDATTASERVLPRWVAEQQITRAGSIPVVEVAFRPMRYDDLPAVVAWQQAPHASRWFRGDHFTLEAAHRRYGPRIDGETPTRMWVVEMDGSDVGYIQDYLVGANDEYAVKTGDPDAVGFDYVIGEPGRIGHGLGTKMIWTFLRDVVAPHYPEAPRFLASPDHRNVASLRALEKCGFTRGLWIDEPQPAGEGVATEVVCSLDRVQWFG